MLRLGKQLSKETMARASISDFEMALIFPRNIDHVLFAEVVHFFSLNMLLQIQNISASNSISLQILSHLNTFKLKKVSHFGKKTCDQYVEEKKRIEWSEF